MKKSTAAMLEFRRIASEPLPVMIGGGSDVDAVRILAAACLVQVTIPPPTCCIDGHEQLPTLVAEITCMGRAMLRRFAHPRQRRRPRAVPPEAAAN